MNTEKRMRALGDAIDLVERAIEEGKSEGYPGIQKVLKLLRLMKTDLERDNTSCRFAETGIGRHIADQWPFSELGDSVLAAVEAYNAR